MIKRGTSKSLKLGRVLERATGPFMALDRLLERVEQAATHYEVLGVTRAATLAEIRQAHQQAVTLLHPSHYATTALVTDQLLAKVDAALNRVSESFSVLSNVASRVEFDNSLDSGPRRERLGLCIAASVTGYDQTQGKWHEIGRTVEVSRSGVSLRMRRRVVRGSVLHLTLPLPVELRKHGYADPSYEVFAIVRGVKSVTESVIDGGSLVEVEFLGERPPVGYLSKPWAIFNISSPADPNS